MVSMLLYYAGVNDHGPESLHAFLLNWLFFNIAAPAPYANYAAPIWPQYAGFFEPSLANYLSRPVTVGLTILVCGLLVAATFLRRRPRPAAAGLWPLVAALLAYTLVRGTFFFVFNPPEALQFSPATTLAHLLLIGIFFAGAEFRGKRIGLAALAALLLMTNSTFIFLANTGIVPVPQPQQQPFQQQPFQQFPQQQFQQQPFQQFPQQQFQQPMQQDNSG